MASRPATSALVIVALITLGIAVGLALHMRRLIDEPKLSGRTLRPSEMPSSAAPARRPTAKQRDTQSRQIVSQARSVSVNATEGAAATISGARRDEAENPVVGPSRESARVDEIASTTTPSMAGRPFPVSQSVEASCERLSGRRGTICDDVYVFLERMAKEPRSPVWAAQMEAKLREHVASSQQGTFIIRTVECRTTVCALEVESHVGRPYHGTLRPGDALYKVLSDEIVAHGYERAPDGNRITITLVPYTRYER